MSFVLFLFHMTKNKWIPYIEWLWEKRDIDTTFNIRVLTKEHREAEDMSVPEPGLGISDSLNLLILMKEKGIVFEIVPNATYALNKVEEYKWNEFKKELTRWEWTRHWSIKFLLSISSFLIAAIIGGILGGFFNLLGERFFGILPK